MAQDARVLIVARTKMYNGRVCIGALAEGGEHLRLLNAKCGYEASAFQVGELWDVTFEACETKPPHVEDVAVTKAKRIGVENNPVKFILSRIQPWTGLITSLYGGRIRFTGTGSGYISAAGGLPEGATGFWRPDADLLLESTPTGNFYGHPSDYRHLKFVGFQEAVKTISAGTLVRVSLAKWWKPRDADGSFEERCYAQLSGWLDK